MNTIIIRPAQQDDIEDIHEILAAEGFSWSIEEVEKNLFSLRVLLNGKEMAAVLFTERTQSATEGRYAAVHPGYPEALISTSARDLLLGTAERKVSLCEETVEQFYLTEISCV